MKSFWFLQEIVTKIFLANPKVFQQKRETFWYVALLFQRCLVILYVMARDAWSPCHACAGAAVSGSEREPGSSLPGQGDGVCATDGVWWRGGLGLLDRACKAMEVVQTLKYSFRGRKTKNSSSKRWSDWRMPQGQTSFTFSSLLFLRRDVHPFFEEFLTFHLCCVSGGERHWPSSFLCFLPVFPRFQQSGWLSLPAPCCCLDKSVPSASSSKKEAEFISINNICSLRD